MKRVDRFSASLKGPEAEAIVRELLSVGWVPEGAPEMVRINYEVQKPTADWLSANLGKAKHIYGMYEDDSMLDCEHDGLVGFQRIGVELDDPATLLALGRLPFEVAALGMVYNEWFDPQLGWDPPGFSDGHVPLGWACGFKGAGHDRLVSRRWLDHGPWRVVRQEGDVTWVVFHDLAADPVLALEQAAPGHARMGISDEGGFIQSDFVYKENIKGVYDLETRLLRVPIANPLVPSRKMLEMAAVKQDPRMRTEQPIDQVAFVFIREEDAHANLHEIWLHGLECWALVKGVHVRLDADYHPQPHPPAWVEALACK